MKIKKRKNKCAPFTSFFLFVVLMALGIKVSAQCTVSFTYTVNPSNSSQIAYTQTSTGAFATTKYFWDFGDGQYDTMQSPTHTYNHSGFFVVCLSIKDSLHNCSQSYCDSIPVNNGTCSTSFGITEDTANTFTFSSTTLFGTPPYTFMWDFGDSSSISTQQNPVHQYADTGFYYVCLTVTDANNIQCNHCEYKFVAGYSDSCKTYYDVSRDSSNLSILYFYPHTSWGRPPYKFSWDFGDGTTSTAQYPTHQYADTGYFNVCLTVVDSNGVICGYCASPHSGVLTKGCIPFTYAIDSVNLGLYNFKAPFYNHPPSSYLWSFGDGTTSSQANPTHQYSQQGYFNVCMAAYDSSGVPCNFCQYINVDSSKYCSAAFTVVSDSTNKYSFYIFVDHTNNNLSYFWDFGDGTTSNLPNPAHNYTGSGPYLLCLKVSGSNGCFDTYCDSIYAGRSNGLSLTIIVPVVTKIDETHTDTFSDLSSYPNPFSKTTTITYSIKQDAMVELNVIDLLGKKIALIDNGKKTSGNHFTQWDAENIAPGIYLLQLNVNDNVSTKKLIITQ